MATPTVFAQVVGLGHREIFRRCVQRYQGDAWIKDFGCHDQWLAMAFAQLTFRESLRDLESSLCSRSELLYQMGFRSHVRRSTLADANERRDWRIYADWAQSLIRRARRLYAAEPFALELDQTVYAFDATVTLPVALPVPELGEEERGDKEKGGHEDKGTDNCGPVG